MNTARLNSALLAVAASLVLAVGNVACGQGLDSDPREAEGEATGEARSALYKADGVTLWPYQPTIRLCWHPLCQGDVRHLPLRII